MQAFCCPPYGQPDDQRVGSMPARLENRAGTGAPVGTQVIGILEGMHEDIAHSNENKLFHKYANQVA